MSTHLLMFLTRSLLLIVVMAALIAIVACGGAAEDEGAVSTGADHRSHGNARSHRGGARRSHRGTHSNA